ncbi:MAG: SurA N-terminal domain-containing protein [Acidobacteriota bacterium]|nr:SurA N-terminal domain-containing protein [Acidobacteriota bacterium]
MTLLVGACRSTPAATPAASVSADAWAVVDGREITRDEVEKAYRRISQANSAPSEDEALTAKLNLLNELIVQDILLAKARELKIELTDAELDTAYADGRKDIPEEAFQQELTRRNLTAADMREGLRRDLTMQKVIEREVASKITVTDDDVAAFFNANRAQFNRAEEAFRIAQIVVTPGRDTEVNNRSGDDATTPQEAAGKVQMLMERLKSGASFGDLAADFSEDPQTAPRGGDLGFVPVSALEQAPPPLRDAIKKSSPGTVSSVNVGGTHTIVLLVAREAAGQRDPSMPEVREGIAATLRGRKEQLLRAAYLTAIRNDVVVVNHLARRLIESPGQMPGLAPAAPGAR